MDSFEQYKFIVKNIVIYYDKTPENYIVPIAARRVKKDEIKTLLVDLTNDEWIFLNNLHIHHNY